MVIEDSIPLATIYHTMISRGINLRRRGMPTQLFLLVSIVLVYFAIQLLFGCKLGDTHFGTEQVGSFSSPMASQSKNVPPSKIVQDALDGTTFIKAVTYPGSESVLTWLSSSRLDGIDEDFSRLVREGFNTIILIVPWSGIQLKVVPPEYDKWMLSKLASVFDKAKEHNLRIITRVSYPHSFNPKNDPPPQDRCFLLLSKESLAPGVFDGWMDYMATLNDIFMSQKYSDTYLYSFMSWEDFSCLLGPSLSAHEGKRLELAKTMGYNTYMKERFPMEELETMFGSPYDDNVKVPLFGEGAQYEAWINFADNKWWGLVQKGRKVHPRLTMEVRVEKMPVKNEQGEVVKSKSFDLHHIDNGPPRQGYWASYYGTVPGTTLTADQALASLERMLKHTTDDGKFKIVLSQFNYLDNTPNIESAVLDLDMCGEFLRKSSAMLRKYTVGYGLWAYRNYRQSPLYNSAFIRGTDGWELESKGLGGVVVTDEGITLEARGDYVSISQKVEQQAEARCDDKNNKMQFCFSHKGKGKLSILWNNNAVETVESGEDSYVETCVRLPPLEESNWYMVGLRAEKMSKVSISSSQFFCHTHDMKMHDIHNNKIATCGDYIPQLNALLDSGWQRVL